MNFLIGGVSGIIATCVIQPIDLVKVQIQIRSEMGEKNLKALKIAKEIFKENKSFKPFYKGLDSAILRQVLYISTRNGVFYNLTDFYTKKYGKKPTILANTIMAISAGAIGSFMGNPADLALVRMQADRNLQQQDRRNYKNVSDALIRIVKEEGIFNLWRGSSPTIKRGMAITFSLLVPFEETKKLLTPYVENPKTRSILSSLVAGGFAAVFSLPFDNVKTKLQKMKKSSNGIYAYNGVLDCISKTIKNEGISKLWVGLETNYIRIAPYAIISFVCNDILRNYLVT